MAEQLDPQDIARRSFEVSRRGYDQQAVRAFLHEVSSLVERLARAQAEHRERADRAETRLSQLDQPDEGTLLELLGEETARVLTSARDAATEIRSKAESSAERLISEATTEAADIRSRAAADADHRLTEAAAESESRLAQANSELERRSAEAEEAAAGIREEGAAEARRLREEGQAALAEARAQAEQVAEAARDEGRRMVAEAQAVRERVLRDLAVRRKKARLQVEKLNAGRERLLEAYALVRRTIDEATTELQVSLSDARLAADAAARRIEEEPEPTLEQLDEEVSTAGLVDLPIAGVALEADELDGTSGPFSGEVPVVTSPASRDEVEGEEEPGEPGAAAPPEPEPEPEAAVEAAPRRRKVRRARKEFEGLPAAELVKVDAPRDDEGVRLLSPPDEEATGEAEPEPAVPEEPVAAEAVDDLFARLRGEREEPGAAPPPKETESDEAGEPGPSDEAAEADREEEPAADDTVVTDDGAPAAPASPDASAFLTRAAALEPVDKELARRLKRLLADEQNEVLDLLRRAKPKGLDELLPSGDGHAARWADAATEPLADAAQSGAELVDGAAGSVADLADELARTITVPLRERIDRSFVASDGNLDDVSDRVRALYREWKGQRVSEASAHFALAAYGRGAFDGLGAEGQVRWVPDPAVQACVDCEDNVLAGTMAKGAEFPTGHACAPAHPGCTCLVLAAT